MRVHHAVLVKNEAQKKIDLRHAKLSNAMAEFVGVFQRFEFALKERGYARDIRGYAEVDWNKFVSSKLDQVFYDNVRASGRADTLIRHPPKKQIVREGKVDFELNPKRPKDVQELFVMVRRVRNNLLHGGKSGDPEPNRQRNNKLIVEAQWVLEEALRHTETVKDSFEGTY